MGEAAIEGGGSSGWGSRGGDLLNSPLSLLASLPPSLPLSSLPRPPPPVCTECTDVRRGSSSSSGTVKQLPSLPPPSNFLFRCSSFLMGMPKRGKGEAGGQSQSEETVEEGDSNTLRISASLPTRLWPFPPPPPPPAPLPLLRCVGRKSQRRRRRNKPRSVGRTVGWSERVALFPPPPPFALARASLPPPLPLHAPLLLHLSRTPFFFFLPPFSSSRETSSPGKEAIRRRTVRTNTVQEGGGAFGRTLSLTLDFGQAAAAAAAAASWLRWTEGGGGGKAVADGGGGSTRSSSSPLLGQK